MKSNLPRGITLIGMPTCGKSTIGKILAAKLGYEFLDVDRQMESVEGMDLPTIIRTKGDDYVLDLEYSVVRDRNLDGVLVSTPGSVIYGKSRPVLRAKTDVVYIKVPLDEVVRRLGSDDKRQGEIIGIREKGIDGLYRERTPMYEDWAHHVLEYSGKSPRQMAEEIIVLLKNQTT